MRSEPTRSGRPAWRHSVGRGIPSRSRLAARPDDAETGSAPDDAPNRRPGPPGGARALVPIVLLAVLTASIPLKAWTISASHGVPDADLAPALAGLLAEEGFTTGFEHDLLGYSAALGVAGSCRVWLGAVASDGWHRDIVVSNATESLAPAFFFEGRAYADQPAWTTWLRGKAHWFSGGLARPAPVVAALIGRDCVIDRSRWAERLGRL